MQSTGSRKFWTSPKWQPAEKEGRDSKSELDWGEIFVMLTQSCPDSFQQLKQQPSARTSPQSLQDAQARKDWIMLNRWCVNQNFLLATLALLLLSLIAVSIHSHNQERLLIKHVLCIQKIPGSTPCFTYKRQAMGGTGTLAWDPKSLYLASEIKGRSDCVVWS